MAKNKDLGSCGRIRMYAEMNHDRQPASWQVWVEFIKDGKEIGTSSGNCAIETGCMECDNGKEYKLSRKEMEYLDRAMDENEGIIPTDQEPKNTLTAKNIGYVVIDNGKPMREAFPGLL